MKWDNVRRECFHDLYMPSKNTWLINLGCNGIFSEYSRVEHTFVSGGGGGGGGGYFHLSVKMMLTKCAVFHVVE